MSIRRIVLMTDFGLEDHYVGVMKGVIASIAPDIPVIDLCHGIPRQNVQVAAKTIRTSAPYFPSDSLHTIVVDPGVGSSRSILYAQSSIGHFLAPDNGVLYPILSEVLECQVYELSSERYQLKQVSNTFHGRDKFAPYAAHLANGIKAEELGKRLNLGISGIQACHWPKASANHEQVNGTIDYIDIYGNASTNIERRLLENHGFREGDTLNLKLNDHEYSCHWARAYSEVKKGEPLLIINSFDCLEISINHGNAAQDLSLELGQSVIVEKPDAADS